MGEFAVGHLFLMANVPQGLVNAVALITPEDEKKSSCLFIKGPPQSPTLPGVAE
jgi:hypothetical protein